MLGARAREALARAVGCRPPRFRGANPEHTAWLADQIWAGEYDQAGFVPRRGWRILDIGANVGTFAVRSAMRRASVVAYEPHPETFRYLQANAAKRGVDCRQAAVVADAPEDGVDLHLGSEDTRHSLLSRDQDSGVELGDAVRVPAVAAREVIPGTWDLVKIDCEGVEFEILDSLSSEDIAGVRRMIVELHGTREQMTRFVDRLRQEGFHAELRDLSEPRLALCFATRDPPASG
jgi:FkbM family methyltransferase